MFGVRRRRRWCRRARTPTGPSRRRPSGGCSRGTAGCRAGRWSARGCRRATGMSWKPMAALSPWVNRTKHFIAAGVVDAPGLLRAGVDRVGAGVEVVVDAARRPGRCACTRSSAVDQPDPLRSSLNTTRRPVPGARPVRSSPRSARACRRHGRARRGAGSAAPAAPTSPRSCAPLQPLARRRRRPPAVARCVSRAAGAGRPAGVRAAARRRRAPRPPVTASDGAQPPRSGRSAAGPRRRWRLIGGHFRLPWPSRASTRLAATSR